MDLAIEKLPLRQMANHARMSSYDSALEPSPTPQHYAVPPIRSLHTKPAKPKRIHYTEIDVSLYDNPKLNSMEAVAGQGEMSANPLVKGKQENGTKKKKRRLLHEDLLVFVCREWKDLDMEVHTALQFMQEAS